MKKLNYTKANNPDVLTDELKAAIPSMRSTPTGLGGRDEAAFSMTNDGTAIELLVPDDVTKAAVDAVIAAHTNPPPPDRTPPDFGSDAADLSDYQAVRQWVTLTRAYVTNGSPTAADTVAQVKRNSRAIMAMLRRMI